MRFLLASLALGLFGLSHGQGALHPFTENKGQWPARVLFRAMVPGGALFIENEAFTYVQVSGLALSRHGQAPTAIKPVPKGHAWRVHFVGGMAQEVEPAVLLPQYENFYLGSDPDHWGSGCRLFGVVLLKDVWPGIDIRIDGRHGMKYDVLVAPGADPSLAKFRYEGQEAAEIRDGEIRVQLSTGIVVEEAPLAYSVAPTMDRYPAPCSYRLTNDVVAFDLMDGHDPSLPLVIDPVLTFASYSGSTADNFGFTATYDEAGHLYGAGVVFAAGYPTSVGPFDPTFNGGTVDVGVSKWSTDGSTLVWSTYLGGTGNEAPHSMVTNEDSELYIMGSTGSSDFPTTPGCYSALFQGGPVINFTVGYGFNFPSGSDVFVTHLNQAGTALIGSTFIGGSGTDGVNTSTIAHNYGDAFRGEIALDPGGNPVVATSTASGDLPVTPGAPQGLFGGGQLDAFVFRMNPTLSTLLWATYFGGNGSDTGHGLQFDSTGEVFLAGGTSSSNLLGAGSPLQNTNAGGTDGYIARFSPSGNALLSRTYLGTGSYDQAFFVQLDTNDEVYVVGQTNGNYPVSPGVYANPGSSQFIHKLSHDLSATIWSTRIGNGAITQDLSPSAFLVSDCGLIYFSGWAGTTNNLGTPNASTTVGSPVTPDAFQPTTNGSDFYLMVLEPDAAGLNYATFFGGNNTSDHVDGGTSRFDKDGTVYQAVCAGCGGQDSFPTTVGAYSNTNNSFNCNLGVFKFELSQPLAVIGIDGPSTICYPSDVQFTNNSIGGNTYQWTFGDGGVSDEFEPSHTYTEGGTFTVTLILSDTVGCAEPDTATIVIESIAPNEASIDPIPPLCPGGSVQLVGSPADSFEWFPVTDLDDPFVQNPVASPDEPITYFYVATTFCGTDTASIDVVFADPQGSAMPDTLICAGDSVVISASGGVEFLWSPGSSLDDPTSPTPTASPSDTITYTVQITTAEGCTLVDSLTVNVHSGLPSPTLSDTTICLGTTAQLSGPDADSYQWSPAPGISTLTIQNPTVEPSETTQYVVLASNVCGGILDSALVSVMSVEADAWPDTLICPGNSVELGASGGATYSWSPTQGLDNPTSQTPTATVNSPASYTVTVTDELGCTGSALVNIGMLPPPEVFAWNDQVIDLGDRVEIHGSGTGIGVWEPDLWIDCTTCPSTWVQPEESMVYTITYTDGEGCTASASVSIILNGTLFVPNTFTPNGDGVNDVFGAWGTELDTFHLMVFNRWGELIFESNSIDRFWDGTYKGVASQIDTYVWRVEATELSGRFHSEFGHVNLIR